MKTVITVVALVLIAAVPLRASEVAASAQPVLELTPETLTVRSVSPGGSVVLFSVAREPIGGIARVVSRHELLVDDDRDGVIRYAPPSGLVPRSVWMVIDVETGTVAVGTPLGIPPTLMRPHGAGEGVPVQAVANRLDIGREEVDVLVLRPGEGAWAGVVRDGGPADRDNHANGRLHLDPSKLDPIAPVFGDAPSALKPGDVLAILDAARLEYWYGTAAGGGQ